MQDSLGGNAKTCLLINCSPSSYNTNETLSTLRFGSRAKAITNKPKINEQRSVEELSSLLQKAENAIDMQQSYILALEGQLRAQGLQSSLTPGRSGHGDGGTAVALQSRVAALTAELSEERDEARRVMREVDKLTLLLKDKERLLQEASALMKEAQAHVESHRSRAEQLEATASKAADEAASATEAIAAAQAKAGFEARELEVRLETLAAANEKLTLELEQKEAEEVDAGSAGAGGGGASVPPPGSWSGVALSEAALEALPADVARVVRAREAAWTHWAKAATPGAGSSASAVKEIEAARNRLSVDLQAAAEKNLELEMELNQLKAAAGPEAEKIFTARERNHVRMQKKFESLQQRLEQLVAVHRQLLRKYAALELDSAEDKKKIALRDERIAQLEANTRALALNMRTQAARHVVELTKLREQVSTVRQEQMDARLGATQAASDYPSGSRTAVIRGGSGPQPVRAIRGGGTAPR